MVQRFQPTPLNAPSYRVCGSVNRAIDGARQGGIRLVHHHARESAEHHFDLTPLVGTAFWPVSIGKPNGNSFD
jgi:hypothetical protein